MAVNGFSGLYFQDKVHCPKYTRFNLQGHIFLLQGHIKKCVKNTLILMPDAWKTFATTPRKHALCIRRSNSDFSASTMQINHTYVIVIIVTTTLFTIIHTPIVQHRDWHMSYCVFKYLWLFVDHSGFAYTLRFNCRKYCCPRKIIIWNIILSRVNIITFILSPIY
jgi:hypothetical protein